MTANSTTERIAAIRDLLGAKKTAARNSGKKLFDSPATTSVNLEIADIVKEDLRQILNRVQIAVRSGNAIENTSPNSGLPSFLQRVTEIS